MQSIVLPVIGVVEFFEKYRRKIFYGTLATGAAVGGWYLYKFLKTSGPTLYEVFNRVRDIWDAEKATKDFMLRTRLYNFLRVATGILRNQSSPRIRRTLVQLYEVETIRGKMGQPGLSQNDKTAMWEQFKIAGLARTLCAMQSLTMLHHLCKLQFCIMGRHLVHRPPPAAAIAQAAAQAAGPGPLGLPQPAPSYSPQEIKSFEVTDFAFTASAEYAMSRGLRQLAVDLTQDVASVFGGRPVESKVTAREVKQMFTQVRDTFLQRPLLQYLVDEKDYEAPADSLPADRERLQSMQAELRALVSTRSFLQAVTEATDMGLIAVMREIQPLWSSVPVPPEGEDARTVPLVQVLIQTIRAFTVLVPELPLPPTVPHPLLALYDGAAVEALANMTALVFFPFDGHALTGPNAPKLYQAGAEPPAPPNIMDPFAGLFGGMPAGGPAGGAPGMMPPAALNLFNNPAGGFDMFGVGQQQGGGRNAGAGSLSLIPGL